MIAPCAKQRQQIDHLVGLVRRARRGIPSTLLTGPPGAGKRAVARLAAEELGLDFVEVLLAGPPRAVKEMLFGTREQAEQAYIDGLPPGYIGEIRPHTLLYLVRIEELAAGSGQFGGAPGREEENDRVSLLHSLHGLINRRSYSDQLRSTWQLNEDIWIVGALRSSSRPNATDPTPTIYEHWLSSAFETRFGIEPPTDPDNLFQIAVGISSQLGVKIDPRAKRFFRSLPLPDDNLHTCQRWIELAANSIQGESLSETHLQQALVQDLRSLLARITYRAESITEERVHAWVKQFPKDLQQLAVSLVRSIAQEYYVSPQQFHQGVEQLRRKSDIANRSKVVFCRWQPLGDSAPKLTHILKTQAGWESLGEVDLNRPDEWGDLARQNPRWFILVDDFVGSGGTVARLFTNSGQMPLLPRLLDLYPRAEARILVLAGFEDGLRRIRAAIPDHYRNRIKLVAHLLWNDGDKCFSAASRIVPSTEQQEQLKSFCIERGEADGNWPSRVFWLGYKEAGALIVFHDSVPNNSLPILWHRSQAWQPLFPRNGLPE